LGARYAPRTKPETLKHVIEANLLEATKQSAAKVAKIMPSFNALKGI
jgi:glutathione peroxidase